MFNVLIADDHAIFREGLKLILQDFPEIEKIDEASNFQEAVDKVWKNNYEIVLLDIAMPGRSGLEVLKEIKNFRPKLPVLMLSTYPEERYAIRAFKGGASGYLTKTTASEELITAIRKICSGSKYVSQSLAVELANNLSENHDQPIHKKLSDREYEVMCLLASGKSVKDIAFDMLLSVKTISTFRTRILNKMQMKNTAEIMYYAIKNELVD